MKDETQSQLHSLCQTRQKLVEQRTGLMNKLHNLCVAHGLKEKREAFASEKGLVEVLQREVWSATSASRGGSVGRADSQFERGDQAFGR